MLCCQSTMPVANTQQRRPIMGMARPHVPRHCAPLLEQLLGRRNGLFLELLGQLVLLAALHGELVLHLVVPDVAEHVVEAPARRPALHVRVVGEGVQHVDVAAEVVRDRHEGRRQLLQLLLVLTCKLLVRVDGVPLHEHGELVGQLGGHGKEGAEQPEVEHRCMLRQEAVAPGLVPAEGLHDHEVVHFVPLLRKVHLAHGHAGAEPAEALVEVHHADVRHVRHARHLLQEPEALDGAPREQVVRHQAQRVEGALDEERRVALAALLVALVLQLPALLIGQRQLLQLLAQLHNIRRLVFHTRGALQSLPLLLEVLRRQGPDAVWDGAVRLLVDLASARAEAVVAAHDRGKVAVAVREGPALILVRRNI
mmetsp:Transcript_12494/g.31551  ORF Transcript_12494/g.31551 Transcript_12494/m.31551 type:complete len:367 (-) Transcript_12494:1713-2813(-)